MTTMMPTMIVMVKIMVIGVKTMVTIGVGAEFRQRTLAHLDNTGAAVQYFKCGQLLRRPDF